MGARKKEQTVLEELNRWLVENSITGEKARATTNRLHGFCFNHLGSTLPHPVELGVTAKRASTGITVWLCILWPSSLPVSVIENNQLANDLIKTFAVEVEIPSLPNPSVHLEYVLPEETNHQSLTAILRGLREEGREYIGVFYVS